MGKLEYKEVDDNETTSTINTVTKEEADVSGNFGDNWVSNKEILNEIE